LEADFYLKRASKVVDELLVGVVYDVDDNKMPTDPDTAEALSDATCAIALEAKANGSLSSGNIESNKWTSVRIGDVQLSQLQDGPHADPLIVLGLIVPTDAILSLTGIGERFVWVQT
jgi:hypothetical protein